MLHNHFLIASNHLQFKQAPQSFKLMLFAISLFNFAVSYLWEVVFLQDIVYNQLIAKYGHRSRHVFDRIGQEIRDDQDWPPNIGETMSLAPKYKPQVSIDEEGLFVNKRKVPVWRDDDIAIRGQQVEQPMVTFNTFSRPSSAVVLPMAEVHIQLHE